MSSCRESLVGDGCTSLATLRDPRFSAGRLVKAGMSEMEAGVKGKRFAEAARRLAETRQRSDEPAVACFVPGRIEVLGKHTDYCGGRSLLCTVERGMCFVGVANPGPNVLFHALNRNESAPMAVSRRLEPVVGLWSNYPMTVCRRLALNFPGATGADIAMSSDLPPASGLSSSSAMVIGTFLVLSAINNLPAWPAYRQNIAGTEDLAAYLGCCENGQDFRGLAGDRGVGTFGGSQDHVAILCCKPGHLSVFSFCPVRHESDVKLPAELRFLIASSGVSAEKTGYAMAKYNLVSERARKLLDLWNNGRAHTAVSLRDAVDSDPSALVEMGRILEQNGALDREMGLASRLEQFLTESNVLIPEALEAIGKQQWAKLGQIVDRSQGLAETGLRNQVPQTVALQRKLRADGAIAASSFGAGFGGSVWALTSRQRSDHRRSEAFFSRPSCPARVI